MWINLVLSNKKQRNSFWPKTWAGGTGKECGCQQPQAFSTSAETTDLKRWTLPIQSMGETPVWADHHLPYCCQSLLRGRAWTSHTPYRRHQWRAGLPGSPSCNAELIGEVFCWIGGTCWGVLWDTSSFFLWQCCLQPGTREGVPPATQIVKSWSCAPFTMPQGLRESGTGSDPAAVGPHVWGPFCLSCFGTLHLHRSLHWSLYLPGASGAVSFPRHAQSLLSHSLMISGICSVRPPHHSINYPLSPRIPTSFPYSVFLSSPFYHLILYIFTTLSAYSFLVPVENKFHEGRESVHFAYCYVPP